jgi:hypothetical protein
VGGGDVWQTRDRHTLERLAEQLSVIAAPQSAQQRFVWNAATLEFDVSRAASASAPDRLPLVPRACWRAVVDLLHSVQRVDAKAAALSATRFLRLLRGGALCRQSDVIASLIGPLAFCGDRALLRAEIASLRERGLLESAVVRNALVAALARAGEASEAVALALERPALQLDGDATAALILGLQRYMMFDAVELLVRQWLPVPPHAVMSACARTLVEWNEVTAAVEVYNSMLEHHGPCMEAFHAIVFALHKKRFVRTSLVLLLIEEHRSRGVYLSPAVLLCERKLARARAAEDLLTKPQKRTRGQAFARALSLRALIERSLRRGSVDELAPELRWLASELRDESQFEPLLNELSRRALSDARSPHDVVVETLMAQYEALHGGVRERRVDAAELPALFLEASFQLAALDHVDEALAALGAMIRVGLRPRAADFEPILEQITTWDAVFFVSDYARKVTERYSMFRKILDRMQSWALAPPPSAFEMLLRFAVRTRRYATISDLIASLRKSFAPLSPSALWRVLHRATCEDDFALACNPLRLDPARHSEQARYQASRSSHVLALVRSGLPSVDVDALAADVDRSLPHALLTTLHLAGQSDASVLPGFVDYFSHLRHLAALLAVNEFSRKPWRCFGCRLKCRANDAACPTCGVSQASSLAGYHVHNVAQSTTAASNAIASRAAEAMVRFPLLDREAERTRILVLVVETVERMHAMRMRLSDEDVALLLREYALHAIRFKEARLGAAVDADSDADSDADADAAAASQPHDERQRVSAALVPPLAHLRKQFGDLPSFLTLEQHLRKSQ